MTLAVREDLNARTSLSKSALNVADLCGRLTVLELIPGKRHVNPTARVRCICGVEKIVSQGKLRSGSTTSCGCYRRETTRERGLANRTHGLKHTRTYHSWQSAKQRCSNGNVETAKWTRYGGRGIQMCERWLASFEDFLADMGERPVGLTLDRIDPDGDYEPGNCRWADATTQRANRSHPG